MISKERERARINNIRTLIIQDLARSKRRCTKKLKKNLLCSCKSTVKEIDGERKIVYIRNIHERDINKGNLEIYHCGDVSDEVPPVLIPNTEVKLISAYNT